MSRLLLSCVALFMLVAGTAQAQPYTTPRAILEANIEATGGKSAWEGIKNVQITQDVVVELPQGRIEMENLTWILFPGYMLTKTRQTAGPDGMPAMNNTMYMTPEGGWNEGPMGRQSLDDLPASLGTRLEYAKEELVMLAEENLEMTLLPSEEMDGKDVYPIRIGGEQESTRYYDTKTLLLVAESSNTEMGEALRKASDFREVEGVKFPFHQEMDLGIATQVMTIRDMAVNTDLTTASLKQLSEEK